MKKKIISAAMAVVLMLVACSISAGAASPTYEFDGSNDDYSFDVEVYVYSHLVSMNTYAYCNSSDRIKVHTQCVVVYTDNSYSIENRQSLSSFGSTYIDTPVYLDSGKTISYIDVEVHVYINGVYVGTESTSF